EAIGARRFLVESMAPPGVDLVLGARRDPVFGPVVLLGLGGTAAEALDDVALRLAPLSSADAAAMPDQLAGRPPMGGQPRGPRAGPGRAGRAGGGPRRVPGRLARARRDRGQPAAGDRRRAGRAGRRLPGRRAGNRALEWSGGARWWPCSLTGWCRGRASSS